MLVVGAYVREVLDRATRGSQAKIAVELPTADPRSQQRLFERVVLKLVSGRFSRYAR